MNCDRQQFRLWRTAVHYTSGQLQLATGIPAETYRHWKKVLPPLQRDGRQGPCFSAGDLLAVAVVYRLHAACGIPASAVTSVAEDLFEICNSTPWLRLERGRLIIDLANRRVQFPHADDNGAFSTPMLVVPLQPIVEALRNALFADGRPHAQGVLHLPPVPLPGRRELAPSKGES